jgi:hypothetical protein
MGIFKLLGIFPSLSFSSLFALYLTELRIMKKGMIRRGSWLFKKQGVFPIGCFLLLPRGDFQMTK